MTVTLQAIRPSRFDLISPERTQANVRRSMKRYLNEVKKILQENYNTVPTSPNYTRTHDLQQGWEVSVSPDGSQGFLFNETPYAVFVQGPKGGGRGTGSRQTAAMRNRGWLSISDVARVTRPRFNELMNRSIQGSSEKYSED
jgi:hypothetical protein